MVTYGLTGQSPQRAVAPTEEEKKKKKKRKKVPPVLVIKVNMGKN
jgi:hypothetical protein